MQELTAYIPMDRRLAMARGETLPDRANGAALFADISGFTPLAWAFAQELGPKRGMEELLTHINAVYEALINPLHRYGGSVIGFAGDAITCWLDECQGDAVGRAVTSALALQQAMTRFATVHTPAGTAMALGVKIAVAAGPARRFLVGDPAIQVMDALAGATLERMAAAEKQAERGEVVVSQEVTTHLGDRLGVVQWRQDAQSRQRFAVVGGLAGEVRPAPWPVMPEVSWSEDQVRPWVLPAVYGQLHSGVGVLGDLRPVTSLFLRFSGIDFDGDDAAGEKLDRFVRWIQGIVNRYGGNLIQLTIGDKGAFLYAPFGAPLAHEDDPARAMQAALVLRALPSELDYIGAVQIGLTRGEVWTGACGAAVRHTYGVVSSDVNLSARLMAKAQPGQILVSEGMRDQPGLVTAFDLAYLGDWHYKGLAEPLPTYALQGERFNERLFSGAMVGRDEELQQLLHFAQPLFAGQLAGAAIIYGEAGIGKSRLSYALRQTLGDRVTWFAGQTDQILRPAFNPFTYWLKYYFDQIPQATLEENKIHFDRRLDRLLAELGERASSSDVEGIEALQNELVRTRSILGALVGLHWPDSLYERLDARRRYENTLFALKTLLLAESRLRPVVLEVEDGHWLDGASRELLVLLTRNIADYPLLLVIPSRYADDGSRPAFALAPDTPTLALDLTVLPPAALSELTRAILDGPVDDSLYTLLQEKTQANPFFAQQVLYYLRENDLLEQGPDGTWRVKATDFEIPDRVNAILIARIDRLAQRVKEIVQTAAVLGREFEVQVLSQMLRMDVLPQVQQAEREQIWTLLRELRYLFKHALLRDAAYEMQLWARRRELHRLAAAAMESLYQDSLAEHYGELAYHYETAYQQGLTAVREQAVAYLRQAGEQAAAKYENEAVVDYYSRVLALTPEDDAEVRLALLLGREAAYHLQGEREAQAGDLAALEGLAAARQQPGDQAEVALRWARHANAIGDYPGAIEKAQVAAVRARVAGDVSQEVAGLLAWGEALSRQGEYVAAGEALGQAFTLARAAGRRDLEAASLRELGGVAWRQGDHAGARDCYEGALAIACEIGNRLGEGSGLNNLGVIAKEQGQFKVAQSYYEQALVICREVGNRLGEGRVLGNLGTLLRSLGDYAGAQGYYEQSLTIKREIGDRGGEAISLDNLGAILHILGEYDQAEVYLQQALPIERETGNRVEEGWTLNNLGDVAYAQGKYDQARARFQQALAIRRELGQPHNIAEDLAGLARVALAQGDTTEAQTRVKEVLSILESNPALDGAEHPNRAILTCYRVLHAYGDARAVDILVDAHARLQEQATKITASEAGAEALRRAFLEDVPEHREIVAAWEALQAEQRRAATHEPDMPGA